MKGNKCEVWEGMEGGVVWCGVDARGKGKGKGGSILLMSPAIWEGIEGYRWNGSLIA